MELLAILPDHLMARLRAALERRVTLSTADGLLGDSGLARSLAGGRIDLLVIDPGDRRLVGCTRTLSALLDQYPHVPVALYTALSPSSLKPAAVLLRGSGARELLIAGVDDQPSAFRASIEQLTTDALTTRVLVALAPSLDPLSPAVARAIRMLFVAPHRFRGVEDIAAAAEVTRRHLSRGVSRAGLARCWRLLIVARVLRAYRLLQHERRSLASAAAHLRTDPRLLARHIRLITGARSAFSVRTWQEDELVTRCIQALHR